jgi:predicted RNA polymerase sigma factor
MDMPRMDKTVFRAYNMVKDGNIDYEYWFDKSNEEKLAAAAVTIAVAFSEPQFLKKKLDRTIFSVRKHSV